MALTRLESDGIRKTPSETRKAPPGIVVFLAVACTIVAGLGDWKVLNDALKGLPKVIALGTIVCAFLNFLVRADFDSFKRAVRSFPVFLSVIVLYTLFSMYIWITDFTGMDVISRGTQKILFQLITIIYAVCMCYLFEERAVNVLFFCMCVTNGTIMLLEMPKYGIAQSISSVITCIVTFGNAEGYVRALEIHDITFLFGQFLIYYLMFAPRGTRQEKRFRRLSIALCVFFMLVGLKRSALPAVFMVAVYVFLIRRVRNPDRWVLGTGIMVFLFLYLYLYLVRMGILVDFLESLGIDLMGRRLLWSLPNPYYEFSPFWKGIGFEGVTELTGIWYDAGILNHPYPLHNDILRLFIELGALGYTLWSMIHYILYPLYWMKRHDSQTGLLYMAILLYMTVTYLTDNTALYFWSSVGLRLIPMSVSYRVVQSKGTAQRWKPLSAEEAAAEIRAIEMGRRM